MAAMKNSASDAASLTVSVVLHNSDPRLLERGLTSAAAAIRRAQADAVLGAASITLVDNASGAASREATAEVLRRIAALPGAVATRLLQQERNPGFGAGNNLALRDSAADYHLILNPDVEIARDALSIGIAHLAANSGDVLLSPRVTGDDGRQEFLCKRYPSLWVLLLRGFGPRWLQRAWHQRLDDYEMRDCLAGDEPCPVELASGCFMLVRAQALREVGGFDERFFLYFEDFDLSLRLAGRGRLLYLPGMRIVHHGGYAASKGPRHVVLFLRSALRFFRRHGWRLI
jgi:GT2 family glycosyltransferase